MRTVKLDDCVARVLLLVFRGSTAFALIALAFSGFSGFFGVSFGVVVIHPRLDSFFRKAPENSGHFRAHVFRQVGPFQVKGMIASQKTPNSLASDLRIRCAHAQAQTHITIIRMHSLTDEGTNSHCVYWVPPTTPHP